MNKEFLEKQEKKLKEKKEKLEKELKSFAKKDRDLKNNWDTKFPNFGSQTSSHSDQEENADEVEEYENLLPVEYSIELTLKNVNEALENIKKGNYGICKKCQKEIKKERLEAIPETKLCSNCIKKSKASN